MRRFTASYQVWWFSVRWPAWLQCVCVFGVCLYVHEHTCIHFSYPRISIHTNIKGFLLCIESMYPYRLHCKLALHSKGRKTNVLGADNTTRHNGILDSVRNTHASTLDWQQRRGMGDCDASKRGGRGRKQHLKRTMSKDGKGCFYPTLYSDGSQWYHLMHFFLSLPLIHKYIYWIWDPFRCFSIVHTAKLCHTPSVF